MLYGGISACDSAVEAPRDCDGEWANVLGEAHDKKYPNPSQLGTGIAIAGDGDVVISGVFEDGIDLGAGLVPARGTALTPPDAFLGRYDSCGGYRFGIARHMPMTRTKIRRLALDQDGNHVILLAGTSGESDEGLTAFEASYALERLDSAGVTVWNKTFGANLWVRDLALTPEGATVVIGNFLGSVELDGATLTAGEGQAGFVARFDPDGALAWSRVIAGPTEAEVELVAVRRDASGDLVLIGTAEGPGAVDFGGGPVENAGPDQIAVVKLAADGSHLWSRRFGVQSEFADTVYSPSPEAMALDAAGGVVVTGRSTNSGADDSSEATPSYEVFLVKLRGDGTEEWSRRFGGVNGAFTAENVAVGEDGKIMLAGWQFGGPVSFGGQPIDAVIGDYLALFHANGEHIASAAQSDLEISAALPAPEGGWFVSGLARKRVSLGGAEVHEAFALWLDDAFVATRAVWLPLLDPFAAPDGRGGLFATGVARDDPTGAWAPDLPAPALGPRTLNDAALLHWGP